MPKSGQSYQQWLDLKSALSVKANPYEEFIEKDLWSTWENLCKVPPMRFALVNVDLPYDIAQLAQISLATANPVPHVATYLIGQTLDFMRPKIRNKIMSWNITEENIKWIPRKTTTLEDLKTAGFRLIGTSPNEGKNALKYKWGPRDVVVIGGAKGLSRKNLDSLDEIIRIPCSDQVPFLTTPSVIPILAYPALNERGLWN